MSEDPWVRLQQLRRSGTVPRDAEQRILFEGLRDECPARERELRPRRGMGWNRDSGGRAPHPSKHGLHPVDGVRNIWGK